jgi:hypothetical protein
VLGRQPAPPVTDRSAARRAEPRWIAPVATGLVLLVAGAVVADSCRPNPWVRGRGDARHGARKPPRACRPPSTARPTRPKSPYACDRRRPHAGERPVRAVRSRGGILSQRPHRARPLGARPGPGPIASLTKMTPRLRSSSPAATSRARVDHAPSARVRRLGRRRPPEGEEGPLRDPLRGPRARVRQRRRDCWPSTTRARGKPSSADEPLAKPDGP